MDTQQALIARWRGEPVVERFESGVPPKRPPVGSIRRGPARPFGGGRVPGHGTEGRHLERLRDYFALLAGLLSDLDAIEVAGRGSSYEQLADLLRRLAARRDGEVQITTRPAARRPTERQMVARLREMVGAQLPRRTHGSYRWTRSQPTVPRLPKPRHLPERREIELEVELLLADDAVVG
jgi:hypothetical protein